MQFQKAIPNIVTSRALQKRKHKLRHFLFRQKLLIQNMYAILLMSIRELVPRDTGKALLLLQ